MSAIHSPKTKEEVINRMLSYDFNGDIRTLGEGVSIIRVKPHVVRMTFPDTGRAYDLTVHMPREEQARRVKKAKAKTRRPAREEIPEWDRPAPKKSTRQAGRRQ